MFSPKMAAVIQTAQDLVLPSLQSVKVIHENKICVSGINANTLAQYVIFLSSDFENKKNVFIFAGLSDAPLHMTPDEFLDMVDATV